MKSKRKTKPKLTLITLKQLRSYGPCYDPIKYLPVYFSGTVIDILRHPEIPFTDKLWAVCREDLLSAQLLREFAVAQAKTVRKHIKAGDKKEFDRVLKVCLRFAKGKATDEERSAAESAAWSAARSAAEYAALKMLEKMIRASYSVPRAGTSAKSQEVA